MDTGASSHITGDEGNISKSPPASKHNSLQRIIVGNGSVLPVIGTSFTSLSTPHTSFNLNNVLISPKIVKNLISVHRLTNDNSCSVEFDPYGFSVKDLQTRQLIMRSYSLGDLYPFQDTSSTAQAFAMTTSSGDLWHRHLGHPGHASLFGLANNFGITCNNFLGKPSICTACQLGRQHRLPFSSSSSFTNMSFQLLHCDVWTSPIDNFSGFKYYLIVLDDLSHYSWTFPLRQKCDVSITLQCFYAFVLNHFILHRLPWRCCQIRHHHTPPLLTDLPSATAHHPPLSHDRGIVTAASATHR